MASFCWNQPSVALGYILGLKLEIVFELIGILTVSNVQSFFKHYVSFFFVIPLR